MATQNKAQMKMNFHQSQTELKSQLARIFETLSQRRSHCIGVVAEDDNS